MNEEKKDDPALNCLLALYDCHTADKNSTYREVGDGIIDDMLMGKYDKQGNLRKLSKRVEDFIENYYMVARHFYTKYQSCRCSDVSHYTVYRGSSTTQNLKNMTVVSTIPFSTSIETENALNWINFKTNCCIWVIKVPTDTMFLCIDNPNEGKEVVLPAGKFYVSAEKVIEGITTYECDFEAEKGL